MNNFKHQLDLDLASDADSLDLFAEEVSASPLMESCCTACLGTFSTLVCVGGCASCYATASCYSCGCS